MTQRVVLCLFLGFSSVVAADNAAGEHFQKGTIHFDLGRFREAAKEYEEAYTLKSDPALLFNIGQAYRLAHENEKALHAYRSYLRYVPDAPNAKVVEAQIEALQRLIKEQTRFQARPEQPPQLAPTSLKVAPAAESPAPPAAVPVVPVARPAPLTSEDIEAGILGTQRAIYGCYEQQHVSGNAVAVLRISSSGSVSGAEIEGDLAGTPTGACLVAALVSARFKTFEGPDWTTRWPLTLMSAKHEGHENISAQESLTTPAAEKPATASTPVYKKWWVWTIVAGVVAVGVGVSLGVALTTPNNAPRQAGSYDVKF